MGLQFVGARVISAVSTWGLKHVFRRPAANFPGKVALYVDPSIIGDLAPKLAKGSVCVVGTNGKTTVTNLLADALETAGNQVVCNRTGANLDSGVATALLQARTADWGVFECDELWLAKILPQLQATYVVLLNLFRDQLDRVGEIDRIQESIAGALEKSPDTVLLYNADDPLCTAIAQSVKNRTLAFGIGEDMGLPQNTVADAHMCQKCSTMLEYDYRQYGQLGAYRCPNCDFSRPTLDFAARNVKLGTDGLSFELQNAHAASASQQALYAPFSGAYMVYNLVAVGAAAELLACPHEALQRAIDKFDPQNGRLQTFDIKGRRVLLNLAKNPTGFNQNLKLVAQDAGSKVVAFFVNDKEGDGRDVSWLWDIDFEELTEGGKLAVFAGGLRANDMQVRLKYAGIDSDVVADAEDLLARIAALPAEVNAYCIANYTALPPVHAVLTQHSADDQETANSAVAPTSDVTPCDVAPAAFAVLKLPEQNAAAAPETATLAGEPVVIAHLFPDLLNLYGDGGNVRVLERRLRWRGIPVQVKRVNHGESIDLSGADLVVISGGPDREQRLASAELMRMREELHAFVEHDGTLLAICGGFQILGREWLLGNEMVEGLGIIDMTTMRALGGSGDRLIDNIVLTSPLSQHPVVGYENHAGRTQLGTGVEAFGTVVSLTGHGNNDTDKRDGVQYKNVVGTYLHGPLLAKNPQVADDLLARALARWSVRTKADAQVPLPLAPLDDTVEIAANESVCKKLGVRG